ncbi:MAG: SDR family oxidoreductase [Erythrobacter sp.]|nr:SDR family oxidoreductase [Erythrobacter sp.]
MTQSLKPLDQQTVVITGATSGIGLATARRAAREGANVVMVARNESELEDQAKAIRAHGGRAATCAVDVAEDGYAEKVGEVAKREFGGFDSWVNNAAAAMFGDMLDISLEEHRQVMETGYFGTVRGSLYAAAELTKRGGGALINVGSVLSERAILLQGPYCAMKHAVQGFTEALRMELQRDDANISVTLIKPNGMDTPYPEHARNKLSKPAALPPILYDPELVAKAICFACANPRRELVVGGQGLMITSVGNLFPGITDKVMEAFMGRPAQTTDTAPEDGAADNLFEPREDGRVRSNQDRFVRKTSLALEAQMRPVLTTVLALGGIGAALIASATRRN